MTHHTHAKQHARAGFSSVEDSAYYVVQRPGICTIDYFNVVLQPTSPVDAAQRQHIGANNDYNNVSQTME